MHEYPRLVFGKQPNSTTRYFPDKLPIGVEPFGRRHVLLYLATSATPMDFRLFLLRHAELLTAVGFWTIRVLFPRWLIGHMETYEMAACDHLARPLHSPTVDELRALFLQRQAAASGQAETEGEGRITGPRAFRGPQFSALYRRWLEVGDSALWLARSPVFRDALERREASIECVALPHAYAHLSSLAGSS